MEGVFYSREESCVDRSLRWISASMTGSKVHRPLCILQAITRGVLDNDTENGGCLKRALPSHHILQSFGGAGSKRKKIWRVR